jgi:hypothetical protein
MGILGRKEKRNVKVIGSEQKNGLRGENWKAYELRGNNRKAYELRGKNWNLSINLVGKRLGYEFVHQSVQ